MRPVKKMVETDNFEQNIDKILDDDCLLQIFGHLPIVDRFRLESVSKKWRSLSLKSWSSFKILNSHENIWGELDLDITDDIFEKVIRKCGRYLTTLDFDGFYHLGQKSESLISQYSNIQVLNPDKITLYIMLHEFNNKFKSTQYIHDLMKMKIFANSDLVDIFCNQLMELLSSMRMPGLHREDDADPDSVTDSLFLKKGEASDLQSSSGDDSDEDSSAEEEQTDDTAVGRLEPSEN